MNLKFNLSIVSALWQLLAGQTADLDDTKLKTIVSKLDKLVRLENHGDWKDMVLGLISMDLFKKYNKHFNGLKDLLTDVKNVISPVIAEHHKNLDEDNLQDFMDVYLTEIKKTTDPQSSFYQKRGIESLTAGMIDLFLAGKFCFI